MLAATNVSGAQHPAYSQATSGALQAQNRAKLAPGVVLSLKGFSTVAGFVQIHDSAVVPADGAVPISSMPVTSTDPYAFPIPVCGMPTTQNGIYVCFSSTGPTKTIGGAVCWFEVYFI